MAHCNMKAYEHEKSPCDDMYKGTKTYEEVLERVQTLSSNLQASFQTFEKHRQSGLPKVLQGEAITLHQEQEDTPLGFDKEHKIKSILKNFHRRLKGIHKMKRPYRQKIQRWKQRGVPGHLPSPVSPLLLHHLLLMSIYLRP
jgi:hypothetical protein